MRILFLSNLYPPHAIGGYEIACASVVDALRARGHDVAVLTSWSHIVPALAEPDWVMRRFDMRSYVGHVPPDEALQRSNHHAATVSSLGNTMALLDALRQFRPDVVYVWNVVGVGGLGLLDAINLAGIPWVLHLMDRVPADLSMSTPPACRALYGADAAAPYAAARIVAMGQHLVDEIAMTSGITFRQGVDLVPGWADVSGAPPHEPYLRDGIARFVTAGFLGAHKGVDLILEASALLKAEGLRFHVTLFGAGEVAQYVARARALQLDDVVWFAGPRSQAALIDAYAGFDAFLFPTHQREPFGFAPVESAGCATPPIITAQCGAAERLVGEVHCLKIERDTASLAGAMRRVARGEVDLARLGRAGRRLVTTDLSFGRLLPRIEAILLEHARLPPRPMVAEAALPLMAFLKHNLSLRLAFG
jgi:glycogen(starch) synthase